MPLGTFCLTTALRKEIKLWLPRTDNPLAEKVGTVVAIDGVKQDSLGLIRTVLKCDSIQRRFGCVHLLSKSMHIKDIC